MNQILNEADLQTLQQNEPQKLHVVLYKSNHCFPCKVMTKAMDVVEKGLKRPDLIKFNYVDIDNDNGLSDKERVEFIPTLVVYYKGQEIGRSERSIPTREIKKFITECVKKVGLV